MCTTSSFSFASIRVHLRPFFLVLLLPALSSAAAPVLKSLEPRGAQRGQALKVTLVGDYLEAGTEIISSLPGAFSSLVSSPEKSGGELPLLLQLKEDAAPGLYPIRVRTEDGLSNVLLFSVGILPETVEAESLLKDKELLDPLSRRFSNDTPASAEKLSLPITVNGTVVGPDQDYYRINVKAGEKLVFEVDARRAGSAVDPVVQVLDLSGKEVAFNNDAFGIGVDARVEVTFPQAGDYLVLVHDAKYSEQDQNFYRLKIGSYPFAEAIFPLGWQRGKPVEVSFLGGSLASPVKVKSAVEGQNQYLPIALPGSGSLPLLLRVGDLTEVIEPSELASLAGGLTTVSGVQKPEVRSVPRKPAKPTAAPAKAVALEPSTVMNGRISQPGEVDRYRVLVAPGQSWAFELEAAALGASRLLGVLAVYDAATRKRLALTELGQEAGTNPFAFESSRNEVDPRLNVIIPKEVNVVIVSVEDLLGRGGPNFGYRLTAFQSPPDFTVELLTPQVNLPLRGSAAVEVLVGRRGYDGPIRLTIPDLPDDIVVEGGNIPAEMNPPEDRRVFAPGYLTLTAKPSAKTRSFPLAVWAESVATDPPIRKRAVAPGMIQAVRGTRQKPFKAPWLSAELPAALTKPTAYQLELAKRHIRIVQGGDYALAWKLAKPSQGASPLKIDNPRSTGSIKDLRVLRRPEGMDYMDEGTFHILTTFSTPAVTFDLVVDGSRMARGKTERVFTAPAVTIEIVPGCQIKLQSQTLQGQSGGKIELSGKVEREPGFRSTVRIQLEDLPDEIIAQPVLVAADQSEFRLPLEIKPDAKPGRFSLRVSSVATVLDRKDQQEYKVPDVKAEMVVLAGSQAGATN